MRPHSRGTVHIRSADPAQPPRIVPNYLCHPIDERVIVDGIRMARQLATSAPMRPLVKRIIRPDDGSDAQLLDFARNHGRTVFHPCGTCKMGVDDLAVVDPQLRVRGLDALRVADASVMPTLIGGNTNAPSIMIGEKAADMIRASY